MVPPPGWTTTGNFTVVEYGAPGGFPAPNDPGPPSRGANFFAGGVSNGLSEASQVIDLSSIASAVDASCVTFALDGYLGGFDGQGDNATLTVTFRDAGNASLGSAAIGPVDSAARAGLTGLVLRSTSGAVPSGTRNVLVSLVMTRTDGSYNDGYADNLRLVLST